MSNLIRLRLVAVGESLPTAILVWNLGNRLFAEAGDDPVARRWARLGAAAAGVAGVAAVLVAIANSSRSATT